MNEMTILVGGLCTAATAVLSWLLNRRKNGAEIDNAVVESANLAVSTMMAVMNELRDQVVELTEQAKSLHTENAEFRKQIGLLKAEIAKLRTQLEASNVE